MGGTALDSELKTLEQVRQGKDKEGTRQDNLRYAWLLRTAARGGVTVREKERRGALSRLGLRVAFSEK